MSPIYELWKSGLEQDSKNLELAKAMNLPKRHFFYLIMGAIKKFINDNMDGDVITFLPVCNETFAISSDLEKSKKEAFLMLCEFYGVMPIIKEGEQLTLF